MSTNTILPQGPKRLLKVGSKVVGYLYGNQFIKSVIGSKHKLKYPPAWALDAEVFDREVKPNAREFIIIDKEVGLEYHCLVETFDRLKGKLNRGYGRQYYLTLSHWEVESNDNKHLKLALFGGAIQ